MTKWVLVTVETGQAALIRPNSYCIRVTGCKASSDGCPCPISAGLTILIRIRTQKNADCFFVLRDLTDSTHLIRIPVWGSGKPRREFLHVDDLADAALFMMKHYSGEDVVNVGVGEDVCIAELAKLVAGVVGYEGSIGYEASMPDGTPRKLLDISRLNELGWRAKIPLKKGITAIYRWYLGLNSSP